MKTRTYISIRYAHIVTAGLPRAGPYESGPVDRPLTANPSLFLRALEDGGDCRSFMEGAV